MISCCPVRTRSRSLNSVMIQSCEASPKKAVANDSGVSPGSATTTTNSLLRASTARSEPWICAQDQSGAQRPRARHAFFLTDRSQRRKFFTVNLGSGIDTETPGQSRSQSQRRASLATVACLKEECLWPIGLPDVGKHSQHRPVGQVQPISFWFLAHQAPLPFQALSALRSSHHPSPIGRRCARKPQPEHG